MFYENGQRAEALAEAQAEYDAFVVESEGVWDLLSELDIQTENGLNYSEHDDLTDDLASELARMDVEGPMAEAVADDLEDLVGLYGEANLAWNEKIYGSSFDEDAKEAELQAAWAEADALWDDIQRTVDDWDTTLKNGELPEAAGTV